MAQLIWRSRFTDGIDVGGSADPALFWSADTYLCKPEFASHTEGRWFALSRQNSLKGVAPCQKDVPVDGSVGRHAASVLSCQGAQMPNGT